MYWEQVRFNKMTPGEVFCKMADRKMFYVFIGSNKGNYEFLSLIPITDEVFDRTTSEVFTIEGSEYRIKSLKPGSRLLSDKQKAHSFYYRYSKYEQFELYMETFRNRAEDRLYKEVFAQIIEHFKTQESLPNLETLLDTNTTYTDFKGNKTTVTFRTHINSLWAKNIDRVFTKEIRKELLKFFSIDNTLDTNGRDQSLKAAIRTKYTFNPNQWFQSRFSDKSEWTAIYEEIRRNIKEERKKQITEEVKNLIEEIAFENKKRLYKESKSLVAKALREDLTHNKRFAPLTEWSDDVINTGESFKISEYPLLKDFLYEFLEPNKVLDREYPDISEGVYKSNYEQIIFNYLSNNYAHISSLLPKEITGEYIDFFSESELIELIKVELSDTMYDWAFHYFLETMEKMPTVDLLLLAAEEGEDYSSKLFSQIKKEKQEKAEETERIKEIFEPEYHYQGSNNVQFYLHIGDTNTGKTYQALERLKNASSGCYLSPLRLLAFEVFQKMNDEGISCSLLTGEEQRGSVEDTHMACTIELFDERKHYEVVVIDEAQMISDKDRGFSWYRAITRAKAKEVHIVGSKNIKKAMMNLLGSKNVIVNEYSRDTPLKVEMRKFKLDHAQPGDALVVFSRKKVLALAADLERRGKKVSVIYGSMPPESRQKQVEQFINKEKDIIVSTDAIGMGLNLPIKRVVFLETKKFDGHNERYLTSQEVKQIAGRAGRKGLYDEGKVAFSHGHHKMKNLLETDDQPIDIFTISPTRSVLSRFKENYRGLDKFFDFWDAYEPPSNTKKKSLKTERELFEDIIGTEIEGRLPIEVLYNYLKLPFDSNIPILKKQWLQTMQAMVEGTELPEPYVKTFNLKELELSYKSLGLHLMFLFSLDEKLEIHYWSGIRDEICQKIDSLLVHKHGNSFSKTCKRCNKQLKWDHQFSICQSCFNKSKSRRNNYAYY